MSVFIVLIIASLLVAFGFLISFFWAVKDGQYEDDVSPSVRMLYDDKPVNESILPPNHPHEI
jgi:cbb3-type cytochrome oxidase maturation protein